MTNIIYKFYLEWTKSTSDVFEYNAEEWTKEEMDDHVVHNLFPSAVFCQREKWVNWKRQYKNKFNIRARQDDPYYINPFKLYNTLY